MADCQALLIFWVKISFIKNFCLWPTVFCWAVVFYGQTFRFFNTVWVMFLEEYPWRTRTALNPEV
jgi:hypothetical protein